MKKIISTKFVAALQQASQQGIDARLDVLKSGYDEFVASLFSEGAAFSDPAGYQDMLVYTRAELSGLMRVSKKKCEGLPAQSYRGCGYAAGMVQAAIALSA